MLLPDPPVDHPPVASSSESASEDTPLLALEASSGTERPSRADALAAGRDAATPLVAWSRLEPRLRRALGNAVAQPWRQPVDWHALVREVASLKPLRSWPRLAQRRWDGDLTVVLDRRSEALRPFVGDMDDLAGRLRRRHGVSGLSIRVTAAGAPGSPWQRWLGDVSPSARSRVQRIAFDWTQSTPDARMLVVSDLGLLTPQDPARRHAWVDTLAGWRRGGANITVLAPLPIAVGDGIPTGAGLHWLGWSEDGCPSPRRGTGQTLPLSLDPEPDAPAGLASALTILLAQIAQIGRVYPPLLRALRRALPFHADNGTLEALAWNHPDVDRLHGGCEIRSEAFARWEAVVRRLDPVWAQTAQRLRLLHHAGLPQSDEHLQTLRFACLTSTAAQSGFQANIAAARCYLAKELPKDLDTAQGAQRLALRGLAAQLVNLALPAMRAADASLWRQVYQRAYAEEIRAGQAVPRYGDLEGLQDAGRGGALGSCTVVLVRQGRTVRLLRDEIDRSLPAGTVRLGYPFVCAPDLRIQIGTRSWIYYPAAEDTFMHWQCPVDVQHLVIETQRERREWRQHARPNWATSWGFSRRGHFVEVNLPWRETARLRFIRLESKTATLELPAVDPVDIAYASEDFDWIDRNTKWSCFSDSKGLLLILAIEKIHQVFRYIEPGTFLMGSPDTEPGRYADEGPRHQVTLTEGYWLADTTCTQALWQAVMGNNPSHFKGDPDLPVENVSWDDVQEFLTRLNSLLPSGCEAALPTEAQWEFACRAGTQTPYWFGQGISENQVNFDGNVGKTVPVKGLPANGWGLYQMHGNVWEWCVGSRRQYSAQAVENPPDGQDKDSRALRGGSWSGEARGARSACRFGLHRGGRAQDFGFRFSLRSIKPSQGQVKGSGGAAAKGVSRPAEPGKGASGRGARGKK